MTGKTHITGGIAASLAFAQITNYEPTILLIGGVAGALIPDICHGSSKIGRRLPILSKLISTIFGHRTLTHSLLFLLLASLLFQAVLPNEALAAGILVGMISHIVLDMATKRGVKLLFPLSLTVRLPITTSTGSFAEHLVFVALSVLSVYFGYDLFISA
ncbi:metal-dependent hydrolase [Planococcus sp. ISL-109]|uniref:metal-dependent hydrolase n=1 Tax=Planococcus sp. ISL-109 TaxID=2819166 RepID=UPI001BE7720D|nr:metal-dependent hydrolase [Planococcus sp. ISL-109]MBT2583539.1 metal-dependent hydrolase [Planococcus sp. ISL-109]